MNTLTIVILAVCAAAACASALPGSSAKEVEALPVAAPAELLLGEETRWRGGGGYYRGGGGYNRGGGGYNRGGNWYNRGGGYRYG